MAYTSDDRATVQAAILALANGERVTSVTFSDGKRVQYAEPPTLAELQTLLAKVDGDLAASAGTRVRQVRLDSARGL